MQAQDGGVGTRWKCRHKMAQDGGVGTRDGGVGTEMEVKAERLRCKWRSRQRYGGVDVGKG